VSDQSIAPNKPPRVDEAIKARIKLVPFPVFIPPEERDKNLKDKLKAEWPGILAWMIAGCMQWQRGGLAAPKAVTEARDARIDYAASVWRQIRRRLLHRHRS
jgi:putative DNA primase/helicase